MQKIAWTIGTLLFVAMHTACSMLKPVPTITPTLTPYVSPTPVFTPTFFATATPLPEPSHTPHPPPTSTPVLNPSGAALLLINASTQITPRITSEESTILFVSNRDGTSEIYSMKSDGSEQVKLTDNQRENHSPAWSPDGGQVASIGDEVNPTTNTLTSHIYVLNWADESSMDITPNLTLAVSTISWSPDSRQIAFVAYPWRDDTSSWGVNIFIVDSDGSNLTQLTFASESDVGCWSPTWSPDGTQIVYLCRGLMNEAILISTVSGSDSWSTDEGQVSSIFWLPSGENIAFTGGICSLGVLKAEYMLKRGETVSPSPWPCLDLNSDAPNLARGAFEVAWSPVSDTRFMFRTKDKIQIVDIDLPLVTKFDSTFAGINQVESSASWSPDAEYLAFASDSSEGLEIYRLALDDGEIIRLTHNTADDSMPVWQP
jgi:Tol biopolymer transport system component